MIKRLGKYMVNENSSNHWDENTSEQFLDYGKYFIPAREQQLQIMVELLKGNPQPASVLELCCGEGLLAELILRTYPGMFYYGLDGSAIMLEKAAQRLLPFSDRVSLSAFELADRSWRTRSAPVEAVVTSLAIHHLEAEEKQQLFIDIFTMLEAGGILIISDLVEPTSTPGRQVAADAWDEVVRERSNMLDGNAHALDFFLMEHWNTYRYPDPEDIDHPSPLFDQLKWLEEAGFVDLDVHFMKAGHALFSAWKSAG